MDADRTSDLRDTIGLAIEHALAIDVAPDLRARVRASVARERPSAGWWGRRVVRIGALAIAAAAVLIAIRVGPEPKPEPAPQSPQEATASSVQPPPSRLVSPVQASVAERSARPEQVKRLEQPRAIEPEVLVSSTERVALALLLENIRQGRIDSFEPAARPSDVPLEPPDEITIEPIVIKPLARLELVEGERQ